MPVLCQAGPRGGRPRESGQRPDQQIAAAPVMCAAAAEFDETEFADLVWLITTINAWNRVDVAAHVWSVD